MPTKHQALYTLSLSVLTSKVGTIIIPALQVKTQAFKELLHLGKQTQ